MKKITLLLLLIPFFGFSQTFDFNNSDDGWDVLTGFTATLNPTFYTLTTLPGDGVKKNPLFGTLTAGVNLNNIEAVKTLSEHSIGVIQDLVDDGMNFDRDSNNNLAYTKEAAHSKSRILHADGDATGRELHMFLLKNCPHEIRTDSIVIDILVKK